jgi:guanylate kinase
MAKSKKRPSRKAGAAKKRRTRKTKGAKRPGGRTAGKRKKAKRPERAKKAKKARKRAAKRRGPRPRASARRPPLVPPGTGGLLLVLSGPSGAGKSTLARRLAVEEPRVWRSVSMTTRPPREGEHDGIDYLFVSREEFARRRREGSFLEWAEVHGELYGTPRAPVVDRLLQARDVLLEIDVQGASQVRRSAPGSVLVFVVPPSRAVLEERLRERASESEGKIASRLRMADREVGRAREYDYVVVNDELARAVSDVLAVVTAERNRASGRRIEWS